LRISILIQVVLLPNWMISTTRVSFLLNNRLFTTVGSSLGPLRIDVDARRLHFFYRLIREHRLFIIVVNIAEIFIQLLSSIAGSSLFCIDRFLIFSCFDSLPSFLNLSFNFDKFRLLLQLSFSLFFLPFQAQFLRVRNFLLRTGRFLLLTPFFILC